MIIRDKTLDQTQITTLIDIRLIETSTIGDDVLLKDMLCTKKALVEKYKQFAISL